jgi:hypothetical protein
MRFMCSRRAKRVAEEVYEEGESEEGRRREEEKEGGSK